MIIGLISFALSGALVAAEPPLPPFLPLRAPGLAALCTTPQSAALYERRASYCAGYVRAALENDTRLADCHPLLSDVLDAISMRQRTTPPTDDAVLARDFVVEVARELCQGPHG